MSQLTVIAKRKAKSGAEEELFEELRKLVAPTLAEEGCINYDLHRSIEEPGVFIFYENWTSRELWERHIQSPHIKAFRSKGTELSESSELFVGEKVDPA